MQCSKTMIVLIYGGIALGAGALLTAALTHAKPASSPLPPEIAASQPRSAPHFRKMDEISGIALAGFTDEAGSPLLWGHEERTRHLVLIRTRPADSLFVGEITLPGPKTRDAEDIAIVHDAGQGTIYLEDAGSNRKDMPACVRYARNPDNPAQCTVADSFLQNGDHRDKHARKKLKAECLGKGSDWIFLSETDHLRPGVHPEIRRIPEPSYQDVLRGNAAPGAITLEFDYPALCGNHRCRELPGNKMSDIAASYNTEALAVVVEPDHSQTAYLLTKSHRSLGHRLKDQRPDAAACRFASDGLSDVFRLRNLDTLEPGKVHQAEYIATLDMQREATAAGANDAMFRVTAANFLQLSRSQGQLLVRTTGSAYKWKVGLVRTRQADGTLRETFDVAGALNGTRPLPAAVPAANEAEGVGRLNQEAAAQLDGSAIYYMSECKELPKCSVALVYDNHAYLPGDVDGNGHVDAHDVEALGKFLAGETALYCKAAADANGDGKITQDDFNYLQQYVAEDGPGPLASADPKPGQPALGCGYYAAKAPAVAGH